MTFTLLYIDKPSKKKSSFFYWVLPFSFLFIWLEAQPGSLRKGQVNHYIVSLSVEIKRERERGARINKIRAVDIISVRTRAAALESNTTLVVTKRKTLQVDLLESQWH